MGIVSPAQALTLAREQQLDVVEVAPQAVPPVCRIMDYAKYRYDQNKKEREARKKQKTVHLKEIRMKPNISEHDFTVKMKHLEEFLKNQDKVKVTMTYRGREMTHMEFGKKLLQRLVQEIAQIGELEKPSVQEGRNTIMIFKPK